MNKWFLLALLLVPATAWWDPDWNYSRTISADKNTSLIVGWFTLDTSALISSGKVRYDCGDIRVVEDDAPIGYRIAGCNTTYTQIFFDVDHSLNDYELYYGNPSATSQESSGFFTFYDGFESYSTGSPGAPTWTILTGGFSVNYSNGSQRYQLNSTDESISIAHNPSGNFSVFAELGDPNLEGNPGIMYGYVNTTHYSAAYLNGSEVWVRENTSSRLIDSFTNHSFDYLLVEIVDHVSYIYVNGNQVGTGNYSGGSVGVYADPETASNATIDEFAVFPRDEVGWSLGSETERPDLVLKFIGSEKANMRTIVTYMTEGEAVIRVSLESQTSSDLITGNFANLTWGNIAFNSTGYSVNGTFVEIEGEYFNYTQGKYRFDLNYVKTESGYRRWHIVQFFYNFPAIKHVVFFTANQTGDVEAKIIPWSSCSNYVSINGSTSCVSNMHSPPGAFKFGDADVCGMHFGTTGPFTISETISMTNKESVKEVFWQSYMGCGNFTEKVEHLCGTDFSNCTASTYVPVKTLFYSYKNLFQNT